MSAPFKFQPFKESSTAALRSFLQQCSQLPVTGASPAAVAARSVPPSEFATLLQGLFLPAGASSSSFGTDHRQTLELCFKRQMEETLRKRSSSPDALPFTHPANEVALLLDASLWAKHAGLAEATSPLLLLEDVVESFSIALNEQLFEHVLVPRLQYFVVRSEGVRCRLLFLRLCNSLLRRLSKTSNTAFAGQVSLHISGVCPVDERSALNVTGKFNRENITIAENLQEAVKVEVKTDAVEGAADAADANGSSKMEDAVSTPPQRVATPPTVDAALPSAVLASLPPAPLVGGGSLDIALYTALWGVQALFLEPHQLKVTAELERFTSYAKRVLKHFEKNPLDEKESHASIVSGINGGAAVSVFPKYITGSRLLGLQLRDPTLRRNLLLQLLVFLAHVLNPNGNIDVMRDIIAGRDVPGSSPAATTAAPTSATAAALAATNVSGVFLPVTSLPPLRQLFSLSLKLLKLTPPSSMRFTDAFLLVLSRENKFWIHWKDNKEEKCATIERPPADPKTIAQIVDVEASAKELRDKRAAMAGADPHAGEVSRKRKAGTLTSGGGAKSQGFKGFAKPTLPSFDDGPAIRSESGRLFMGSEALARLFAPEDERNTDVLAFLRSSERAFRPDVVRDFIEPMLEEEAECMQRASARKQRHARRDARIAEAKKQRAESREAAAAAAATDAALSKKEADASAEKSSMETDAAPAVKQEESKADMKESVVKQEASAAPAADEMEEGEEEEVADPDPAAAEADAEEDAADAAADASMRRSEARKVWQLLRLLLDTPAIEPSWLTSAAEEVEAGSAAAAAIAALPPTVSGLDLFNKSEGTATKLMEVLANERKKLLAGPTPQPVGKAPSAPELSPEPVVVPMDESSSVVASPPAAEETAAVIEEGAAASSPAASPMSVEAGEPAAAAESTEGAISDVAPAVESSAATEAEDMPTEEADSEHVRKKIKLEAEPAAADVAPAQSAEHALSTDTV